MSFFRSQGMMAGPLISLEMDLEGQPPGAVDTRDTRDTA
jgi:hypothetical protein